MKKEQETWSKTMKNQELAQKMEQFARTYFETLRETADTEEQDKFYDANDLSYHFNKKNKELEIWDEEDLTQFYVRYECGQFVLFNSARRDVNHSDIISEPASLY